MIAVLAAAALTLSAPQQAPPTHEQAMTCTGVFLFAGLLMAQQAEANPSAENTESVQAAGRLMQAADADRLAAAGREGVAVERSGEMLQAWIQTNIEDAQTTMTRELDPCLTRYMDSI